MMELWSINASVSGASNKYNILPRVISAIGDPWFGDRLLAVANEMVRAQMMSVYVLYRNHPPQQFLSGCLDRGDITRDCFNVYQAGLYRTDITMEEVGKHIGADKLAFMRCRAHEFPLAHRDRIYAKHGITDRLSIAATGEKGSLVAINFYRFKNSPHFDDTEIDTLQEAAPYLSACAEKHIYLLSRQLSRPKVSPEVTELILQRTCSELTDRERQVCVLIASGLTHEGIATQLEISPWTVKTYRDRAFDRLEIRHRNELFALLLSASGS